MVAVHLAALALAVSAPGETVLLDFTAPWCAPCRSMEGTLDEIEQAGYPVRKVNIDRERSVAQQYDIRSIPAYVLLVDGQEAGRLVGAVAVPRSSTYMPARAWVRTASARAIARGQSPDLPPSVPVAGQFERNPLTPARAAGFDGAGASGDASGVTSQALIESSVRLNIADPAGSSYGSGTIIDARQGEALVLTCGHIFRDSKGQGTITVDLFGAGAQKLPGRVVAYDLDNDIGLIAIQPGVPVRVAAVASKGCQVAKGDRVTTVGCNNGGPATAVVSSVTAIGKYLGPPNVQVAGMPVQGRSGGGLFNAQGQVIGVCNAADPADQEGLYAALATIHAQLDKSQLSMVYQERPVPSVTPAVEVAAVNTSLPGPTGAMPGPMPTAGRLPQPGPMAAMPTAPGPSQPMHVGPGPSADGLSDRERATLAELRNRGDGAEVICIVRSLTNPQAKSEVIVLDRASPAFLQQLSADSAAQDARHLTSLRRTQPASIRTAERAGAATRR